MHPEAKDPRAGKDEEQRYLHNCHRMTSMARRSSSKHSEASTLRVDRGVDPYTCMERGPADPAMMIAAYQWVRPLTARHEAILLAAVYDSAGMV